MPDNLTTQSATPATIASGKIIATDEVSVGADLVHFQKVKLVSGVDGAVDLIAGDATYGLDVDVSRVQGTVAVTGTFYQATQPVSGTVAVTGAYQATQPVSLATAPTTPVTGTFWQATQPVSGTVGVTGVATAANQLPDGHNVVVTSAPTTAVTIATMPSTPVTGTFYQTTQPVSLASVPSHAVTNAGTFPVQIAPAVSGGMTSYSKLSVGTSGDATNIIATPAQLYGWVITNTDVSPCYVKFYDSTSAPAAGTTSPAPKLRLMIPGNTAGAGQVAAEFTMGIPFANGIAFTIVTTAPDAGATGVSANAVILNLLYKG